MAKTKISELDAAAANNTDINSVDVSEGCAPSGINNAIREMGAMLKRMDVGTDALTSPDIDGGSIDGATIGTNSVITDLRVDNLKLDGNQISSTDTNGDITLDPNGTGKVNVVGELEADSLDIDGNGTIDGTLTITTDDNNPQLIIKSTDADASSGPILHLFRDSASPADADILGQLKYIGRNDAAEEFVYGKIDVVLNDASDGTEDAEMRFLVATAGENPNVLKLGSTATVFNDSSKDVDFRVESDNKVNAFFIQGSDGNCGIGTATPNTTLEVFGAGSTTMRLHRDNASGGGGIDFYNNTQQVANINAGSGTLTLKADPTNAAASSIISFETDGSEVGRWLAGGGLTFNGDTAAANALDDYEQGTWTPTGATNSGTAATFGSAEGSYVKIGNLVTVNGKVTDVDTTGTTSSSQFRIAGLPFAPVSINWTGSASTNSVVFQSSRTMVTCQLNFSTDVIYFNVTADGNSRTVVDHNHITSGTSDFFFTVQYQTFS